MTAETKVEMRVIRRHTNGNNETETTWNPLLESDSESDNDMNNETNHSNNNSNNINDYCKHVRQLYALKKSIIYSKKFVYTFKMEYLSGKMKNFKNFIKHSENEYVIVLSDVLSEIYPDIFVPKYILSKIKLFDCGNECIINEINYLSYKHLYKISYIIPILLGYIQIGCFFGTFIATYMRKRKIGNTNDESHYEVMFLVVYFLVSLIHIICFLISIIKASYKDTKTLKSFFNDTIAFAPESRKIKYYMNINQHQTSMLPYIGPQNWLNVWFPYLTDCR